MSVNEHTQDAEVEAWKRAKEPVHFYSVGDPWDERALDRVNAWVQGVCAAGDTLAARVAELTKKLAHRENEFHKLLEVSADVEHSLKGRLAEVEAEQILTFALAIVALDRDKLSDYVPTAVWDALHAEGLVETGRDFVGDAWTTTTDAGDKALIEAIARAALRASGEHQ